MLSIMKDELDAAYCEKMTSIMVGKKVDEIPDHVATEGETIAIELYRLGIIALTHLEGAAKDVIALTVTEILKIEE